MSESEIESVQATESGQLSEKEFELELFLHELRDNEFETITHEMLQELQGNFEGYAHQQGLSGELESMITHPNFENTVNGYFETSIGHLVPNIQSELDSFANHVLSHVPIGVEYETFKNVVDSYQPLHSEYFIKRLVRRIGKGVKGLMKRGLKVVGRVAKGAINVGKWAITGPLRRTVGLFIRFIRNSIRNLLKRLVRGVIQRLPSVTRPFVLRAAQSIGLAEYSMSSTEADARLSETLTELETGYLGESQIMANEVSPELELEAESLNAETELEEEIEVLNSGANEVAELLREFDTEWFNYAETELSQISQSESVTPEAYPEVTQPYSMETTPEAYPEVTPEAYPEVTPEAYPEVTQPYSMETTPEAYPEVTQPYSMETTPEAYPEVTPEAYPEVTPEAYPEVTPEAYPEVTPEAYPEVTPEAYPEVTPEAYPEVTPEAYPEVTQPYSMETTPEAYPEVTPEAYPEVTPEAYPEVTPEAYPEVTQPYSMETTPEAYPEVTQPYSMETTPEAYPEVTQPYSMETTPEAYPEVYSEYELQTVNQAYDRFVNVMSFQPYNFRPEFEQFAPAVLAGVRVAFRVIPSLRRRVVGVIARLLERILGRWIPKNIGDLAYRPLASLLLRAMGLEAASASLPLQNRVFAEAVANTAVEAIANASTLPESVLEGDQRVLESELESIVQQAVLNNIPNEVLQEGFDKLKRSQRSISFVSKDRYSSLNRPVRVTLTPIQVSKIRIRRSLFLNDYLRRYHKWDGKSPITLDVMAFRTIPGRARLYRILRDYFGRHRPIRLTSFHFGQLHRMTRRAARMFRIAHLWSTTLPMYFIVRPVIRPFPGSGHSLVNPSPSITSRSQSRGNEVRVGLDTLSRLRVSVYLRPEIIGRLMALATTGLLRGLRAVLNRLTLSGQTWLVNLLTRLRIPRNLARLLARVLLQLAIRFFARAGSSIIQRLRVLRNKLAQGITIGLVIQLPRDILRTFLRTSPLRLPSILRTITTSAFSLTVSAGYNL